LKVASKDNEVEKELERMINKEEEESKVEVSPIEIDGEEFKLVEEV